MKILFETKDYSRSGNYIRYQYVEHNGKKFRLTCETRNGDPCGFKSNKCLDVMDSDGVFRHVVDCKMIGFPYQNDYFHSAVEECRYSNNLFKAFKEFIEKVY